MSRRPAHPRAAHLPRRLSLACLTFLFTVPGLTLAQEVPVEPNAEQAQELSEEVANASPGAQTEAPAVEAKKDEKIDPTETHYIEHPRSKQGLMKISNKGEYFYRVPDKPQKRAGGFSVGSMTPPSIKNQTTDATFSDVYGDRSLLAASASYEYQFWRTKQGKLGAKGAVGFTYNQGVGRLLIGRQTAREKFTLFMIPVSAAVVYRAQFSRKQILIPFAEVGGDGYAMIEARNDNKPNKYGLAPAAHAGGGLAVGLNWLDRRNASRLTQEYSISNLYLVADYRHIFGLSSNLDVSANVYSGGFLFEF